MKILHLPVDLGGHPRALAAAQRALGHEAKVVSLAHSPLGFNGDVSFDRPFGAKGRLLSREWGRYRTFAESLLWADVIHCHFGQTAFSVRPFPLRDPERGGRAETVIAAYARALWLKDLPVWRALRKSIAMTFYGDDVRSVATSLRRNPHTHLAIPALNAAWAPRDGVKQRMVAALTQNQAVMFATNPDLLADLPSSATFLPYSHVDPDAHVPVLPRAEGPLRLVHMPTYRDVKGTAAFLAAVDTVRSRGHAVELTLVEGKSNDEALKILATHDVLLDQLRVGWFGGVGVEAMALGKPVVAYLNPADRALAPVDYVRDLPVLDADPDTITDVLLRIVTMPRGELQQIGAAGPVFVRRWHAPEFVARQVLAAYRAPRLARTA